MYAELLADQVILLNDGMGALHKKIEDNLKEWHFQHCENTNDKDSCTADFVKLSRKAITNVLAKQAIQAGFRPLG